MLINGNFKPILGTNQDEGVCAETEWERGEERDAVYSSAWKIHRILIVLNFLWFYVEL